MNIPKHFRHRVPYDVDPNHTISDKNAIPVCKFFFSPNRTCRNGNACRFSHINPFPTPSLKPTSKIACRNMASKGYCAYGNRCKFLHPAATVTTETEDAILIIDFENQLCNDKNYFNLRIRKTLQELWSVVEIARSHDDIYEQLIINKPRAIIVKDRFSKALLETLRRFIQYISRTNAILILCGEFSKSSQEDEVNLLFMQLGVKWKVASSRYQNEKEYSKSKSMTEKINLILTDKFAQLHNTLICLPQTPLSYCIESHEDITMLKNVPNSEAVYNKVSGIHEADCLTSLAFKRLGNGGVAFLGDSTEAADSIISEIASNKLGLLDDFNTANQIGPRKNAYNEGV